jgi:antitoxin component of MazEF toxin-antitoxin module
MTKTLRAMGNSFGIIIDRPIMDLMGFEPGMALELTPHDGGLLLKPVAKDRKSRVQAATKKVMSVHKDAFKELAE